MKHFKDNSFKLIVWDPPHIIQNYSPKCRIMASYGNLDPKTWEEDLKKGFKEIWRVLEDYGVLIFKWNEASIKKENILRLFEKMPLFGHPVESKIPTHWFCFMKIPDNIQNQTQNNKGEKEEIELNPSFIQQ